MKISIIQPSRNNLKYLKWSYDSIRKNQGNHTVEICIADDFSNDGTWEWCQEMIKKDINFKALRNDGPVRLGHTILYDRLVNELSTADICMIYHADMYLCPGALDEIEKNISTKKIVSLTRIEPPLHPDGPEKVLADWGIEPEQFNEDAFLQWFVSAGANGYKPKGPDITEGIFAPWAFMKADFQEIGGHDPLYAPQSKEDSDIFNRFQLNGVKFIQTWKGCVYHMTCRGSRFNPLLTTPGKNSPEWEEQNYKSTRNFIRKWGHFVKHDEFLKPIIPHKYNVSAIIHNCKESLLELLEPWFMNVYISNSPILNRDEYIRKEQSNTSYDLRKRVHEFNPESFSMDNIDILIEFDANQFTQQSFNIVQSLSEIISDSGEEGTFEIDIFTIKINKLQTYEKELIVCHK